MKKRHFSHCRYCIPIHQAALLSRADRGVSRAFLYEESNSCIFALKQFLFAFALTYIAYTKHCTATNATASTAAAAVDFV